VELPTGERRAQPVRDPGRQGRLADAGCSGDDGDRRRGAAIARPGEQRRDPLDQCHAAGEVADVRWELARRGTGVRGLLVGGEALQGRVLVEDRLLQTL